MNLGAYIATNRGDGAYVPKRPSRYRWSARDARSVCFKEVDQVCRIVINSAGEQDEEDEEARAGYEDEGGKGEVRSLRRSALVVEILVDVKRTRCHLGCTRSTLG